MSITRQRLTAEEIDSHLEGFPDVDRFWKLINQRQLVYQMSLNSGDCLAMTWVCLQDLALMIQTSTIALRDATLDFHDLKKQDKKEAVVDAVSMSRFSFDYAALCMSAGSNHLASAMWHYHEGVESPLGRDYKSARQARSKWKEAKSRHESFSILDRLLDSPAWEVISSYRDSWSHRGIPVIGGEFRYARREIWQDESEPPPAKYFMATKRGDGKVSYDTGNLKPDYQMVELLVAGTNSLHLLNSCSDEFLVLFDKILDEQGIWEMNEKGGMSVHLIPSEKKDR